MSIYPYTLDQKDLIGTGTFAHVLLGCDQKTGSPVAIKVFKNFDEERTKNERRLLGRVRGAPHVVQMREPSSIEQGSAIVFNLIRSSNTPSSPSVNLLDLIQKGAPLSHYQAISCAKQLLESLREFQEKRIIHADLTPRNMIFNPESNLLTVIDLGNAVPIFHLVNDCSRTTVTHRPPEMFLHHTAIGFGIDMWSFGVTFFFLLTGELPFYDGRDSTILGYILRSLGLPSEEYLNCCLYTRSILEGIMNKCSKCTWEILLRKHFLSRGTKQKDQDAILDLLRQIFTYEDRLAVEDALKSPLFDMDLHAHMDCTRIPLDQRKSHFLSVGNLTIPLTASCIHLPVKPCGAYQLAIVDPEGRRSEPFERLLWPGGTLSVPEEFFFSKQNVDSGQPPKENDQGNDGGELEERNACNPLQQ